MSEPLDAKPLFPDGISEGARRHIVEEVEAVYRWLDEQITRSCREQACHACGRCCDFGQYDHRLFVTSPELIHFVDSLQASPLLPMAGDVCPYLVEGACSVHPHRFAGCRIFFCKGDLTAEQQAALTEKAIQRFKMICERYDLAYLYRDLKAALGDLAG